MTGDEWAAKVRGWLGFLVYPSFHELQLGDIVRVRAVRGLPCHTPFVITGVATRKHLLKQRRYAAKIAPDGVEASVQTAAAHFYFIEAAD